jgi:hypothetical protein
MLVNEEIQMRILTDTRPVMTGTTLSTSNIHWTYVIKITCALISVRCLRYCITNCDSLSYPVEF